jgi:hypothetical protein
MCSSCGFPVSRWLEENLEESPRGIPISPIDYWRQWHFFYWGGLDFDSEIEIDSCDRWINKGDVLAKIRNLEFLSPVTGLIIGESKPSHPLPKHRASEHYECYWHIKVKLLKNSHSANESIGELYRPLYNRIMHISERIEEIEKKKKSGWVSGLPTRLGFGLTYSEKAWSRMGIDPRGKFQNKEEYYNKVQDLLNIVLIKL